MDTSALPDCSSLFTIIHNAPSANHGIDVQKTLCCDDIPIVCQTSVQSECQLQNEEQQISTEQESVLKCSSSRENKETEELLFDGMIELTDPCFVEKQHVITNGTCISDGDVVSEPNAADEQLPNKFIHIPFYYMALLHVSVIMMVH